MLFGETSIYKCPSCSNSIANDSLLSGNNFGAKLFSDGKSIAPMLSQFPDLTKCNKCNTIFWLSKLKKIDSFEIEDDYNPSWDDVVRAEFLDLNDYFKALKLDLAKTINEELTIRKHIWWAYNDRIRSNIKMFDSENDEIRWSKNCLKLLKILDLSNIDQLIMCAEINRNLGNFEKCTSIIISMDNTDLNWIKEKLIIECEKGNRYVVQLR